MCNVYFLAGNQLYELKTLFILFIYFNYNPPLSRAIVYRRLQNSQVRVMLMSQKIPLQFLAITSDY